MSKRVVILKEQERVSHVVSGLTKHSFCGFPIVDTDGAVTGTISRNHLIVLLEQHAFFEHGFRTQQTRTVLEPNPVNSMYN